MPAKIIHVAGVGPVEFTRRRGARSIRIQVVDGVAKVSLPFLMPYTVAVAFTASKAEWLQQQLAINAPALLKAGQLIGKSHRLRFVPGATVTSRVTDTAVIIAYPAYSSSTDPAVQAKAKLAAQRALRKQAEALLPERVAELAAQHGYEYRSITIKLLKRRWGSCDQSRNLTFNLFLMQLPWDLIDYVIMHELTHTVHLNHSAEFWAELKRTVMHLPTIRKRMRQYQPVIHA